MCKKTWKIVKNIIRKNNNLETHLPKKLLIHKKFITDQIQIANKFEIFFATTGPNLASIKMVDKVMEVDLLPVNEIKEAC